MNRNKIDKILIEINNLTKYTMLYEDDFNNYDDYVEYRGLLILMIDDNKLIKKPNSNNSILYLTKFGNDVISQGGWVKYLEIENMKSERAEKKAVFDFNVSKWQHNTFWWFFGLAIFGGGYSGYDFIKNLTKAEDAQPKQITKVEMELELSKLRTLILSQKKGNLSIPTNSEKGK